MRLQKNGLFVPVMAVSIYMILRIFEWIGLNSTQGYILQMMLIFYVATFVMTHNKTNLHKTLIVLGGVFCLIGDMFLAGAFKTFLDSNNLQGFKMPFGMLGFFIGNVIWFISLLMHKDNVSYKRFFKVFGVVALALILLWSITIYNPNNLLLSVLALVYCFCLGLNLSYGITNLKNNKNYKLLVIGYSVFIFSDLWIGINSIKNFDTNPYVLNLNEFIIWITYIIALAFIFFFHANYERKNDVISN